MAKKNATEGVVDRAPKVHFITPEGYAIPGTLASNKFFRDVLQYWHGTFNHEGKEYVYVDPSQPQAEHLLKPSPQSPICKKCGLFENKCRNPFIAYEGPLDPLITIVYEGVSQAEDNDGQLARAGHTRHLRKVIEDLESETGITTKQIRWLPITRCADRVGAANLRVKGNWCRHHIVQDLLHNRPSLIIAVGTAALGLLSHKSDAGNWQGKLLTYRGWPDDWLTNADFVLPREDPRDPSAKITGHFFFGAPPKDYRVPLVAVQSPRLIQRFQNPLVTQRWRAALKLALLAARDGVQPNQFVKPWYRFVNDPALVASGLREIIDQPGMLVSYDTETTGLKPLAPEAAIVSMMFRWEDPSTREPKSLGFPWNFRSKHYDNKIVDHIAELAPLVLLALKNSRIVAHNATFDYLYTLFNVRPPELVRVADDQLEAVRHSDTAFNRAWDDNICALADAFEWDTWHMAYTFKQERGSLGLEMMAYTYVPDMAGYEEDMTLLIELYENQLFPGARKKASTDPALVDRVPVQEDGAAVEEPAATEPATEPVDDKPKKKKRAKKSKPEPEPELNPHYLNIEESYYPTHVIPYIMGDVETCYNAREVLAQKLASARLRKIPIADPKRPGKLRLFATPSREWVYTNLMSPAARTLMKVMARGMYVDKATLDRFEVTFPKDVVAARNELKDIDIRIAEWCEAELAADHKWELDLENKSHLRHILFTLLELPKQRLTKTGRKLFGETPEDWDAKMAAGEMTQDDLLKYAALDKFTLNKLAVDHEQIRPLQKYRRIFKLYSTYVRPLRNIFTAGVDKKARERDAHLCADGCIHASFLLTGTRTGRLCVDGSTKLDVFVDGVPKSVEICDLWMYSGHNVTVKTHKNRYRKIVRLYCKGTEDMVTLVTHSGSHITATKGHRVHTKRGWVAIGCLSRWDEVRVERTSKLRLHPEQKQLCGLGSETTMGFRQDQHVDFKACGSSELESVSRVFKGTGAVAQRTIGCDKNRQSQRSEKTKHYFAERETVPITEPRDTYRTNCSSASYDTVFSRTEYPDVWVAEIEQRACADTNIYGGTDCRNRPDVSWAIGEFCDILVQQTSVFSTGVWRVPAIIDLCVVFEGHISAFVSVAEGFPWWTGGNLVVGKSSRDFSVAGANFGWNTPLEGVCVRGRQEGRFCANWDQYLDRNRRGVPHAAGYYDRYSADACAGVQGTSVYNSADSGRNAICDDSDSETFEPICAIRNAGTRTVWDIEVEEDHSYLAQGLFHHNSARDPNLQQLPGKGEVKQLFTSRFGVRGCMYQADLSQIELRLMAAACGDPTMVKAYFDKTDLHTLTTSRIYKLPYEHFSKEYFEWLENNGRSSERKALELKRRVGKTVNFLTGYGGGAFGLQTILANNEVYKTIEECEQTIDAFFDSYPSLMEFLRYYKRFIEDNAVAVSVFGRVRILEEVRGDDREAAAKALRAGCNHVIQSTASDMMLIALIAIEGLMHDAGLESILVSTVHDSLLIDAIRDELPQVHEIVHGVLNNYPDVLLGLFGPDYDLSWLSVPIVGDCEVGLSYHDTRKIPEKGIDWEKLLIS